MSEGKEGGIHQNPKGEDHVLAKETIFLSLYVFAKPPSGIKVHSAAAISAYVK
jgi:hypothetical protein